MKKILFSLCFVMAAVGSVLASQPVVSSDDIVKDLNGNKRFTVSVSTGEGGQIEISGTGAISKNSVASATINTGEDVLLVITPEEGYVLKSLYVDGADVLADVTEGSYTISAISKNMSVSATFEEDVTPPTPTTPADVNNDGIVNTADVVAVYNVILGNSDANADVNNDGVVNTADVVAVYNAILGN